MPTISVNRQTPLHNQIVKIALEDRPYCKECFEQFLPDYARDPDRPEVRWNYLADVEGFVFSGSVDATCEKHAYALARLEVKRTIQHLMRQDKLPREVTYTFSVHEAQEGGSA